MSISANTLVYANYPTGSECNDLWCVGRTIENGENGAIPVAWVLLCPRHDQLLGINRKRVVQERYLVTAKAYSI